MMYLKHNIKCVFRQNNFLLEVERMMEKMKTVNRML